MPLTVEQAYEAACNRLLNGARAYALAHPTIPHTNPNRQQSAARWFDMLEYYCPNGEAV